MMGRAFFGFGGPPKPAPDSDPWDQGIANLVGAWLADQPTLAQQEEAKQRQALMGAHADLYKTEAALKALDLHERARKQSAMQDFLSRAQAFESQESSNFTGPPDPNLTRPTPMEGLAAGFKPEDLAQVSLLSEAMKARPDADRLRILSTAGYKPVGNNQSVDSAELHAAQALESQKQQAARATELQKAQIQAGATLGAARIRGPSGGDRFQIIDSQDSGGNPVKLRVNPQTGEAAPLMLGGQPILGKRKDLTAPIQKTLGDYGDQYTQLVALKGNFKDEYAGQPLLGKARNWAGRTFGDEGQAQFWQASDALDMAVRNKMFGVALSVHEQRLWEAAAIHPGMNSGQVRENINRRIAILEGAINRRLDAYAKGGFDRSQMEMLTGFAQRPDASPASSGDAKVILRQAREALAAGKDRKSVEDKLQSYGIDPRELAP